MKAEQVVDESSEADAPSETIMLRLPALAAYGRIARMSGAELALRRGLSLSAVEDLRLAIDEVLILLLGHRNHEGSIQLRYELFANAVAISFQPEFDDGRPEYPSDATERFAALAGPLLDDFTIDAETAMVSIVKGSI
ncbi:MAG: hypothetical protein V3V01_02955 [Acidimicrobiales bacterium]